MLGVVLWSDASDRKAVIWCEDQGDLAYVNAPDHTLDTGDFFDAGDLVQFEMETLHTMRYASNARLVIENARPSLADILLNDGPRTGAPEHSAEIISFEARREELQAQEP